MSRSAFDNFHPATKAWFIRRFKEPTEAQARGWEALSQGRHTLIAAPTGSGKTLAAFLVCLDRLVRQASEDALPESTQVIYVSPLKALSNDVHKNLLGPLEEIREEAADERLSGIRVGLRTGDTPAHERQAMLRRPPHILVTTPESLFLLLTGSKSRSIFAGVKTVIVDEIHALARDKRGSHLALSLERLARLCEQPFVRIGLSATQRPIEEIAGFLTGTHSGEPAGGPADCQIIDTGHVRELDLDVDVPATPLTTVCGHDTWDDVFARMSAMIEAHRSTIVFVNTRRLAERVAHHLSQLLGEEAVASHHGSLSRELRLDAERRLKDGALKVIVATASLELGIDVGHVDLVCQLGSPRSIATFLQRIGRSGHALGLIPKGRIFALTRDELVESIALLRAVRRGRLDAVEIPVAPLDILAQQLVAAVACEECCADDLYETMRRAWPYRALTRASFDRVLAMVSEGLSPRAKDGAYLHHDRINGRIRARRGARLAALTSGGAIPEQADYRVVTEEDGIVVGTVNEHFAIESTRGDVFLLGNTSWEVQRIRGGEVQVRDARGKPASVPFWQGESPGRTTELSADLSDLRREIAERVDVDALREAGLSSFEPDVALAHPPPEPYGGAVQWLADESGTAAWPALQAVHYIAMQKAALGVIPTQERIVFERFFDESGGMQLVIHAPFGARINRAWGLALRKRFCRSFDFELQASADDDGIVLSLGPQHSFPVESLFGMLKEDNGESILVQALLAVPMFLIRWRWNTNRALFVLRQRAGKKVPPALQRFRADDLLTAVFPQQTACKENMPGDIPIPDHPLVAQTIHDCLTEAMDVVRWKAILGKIERGEITLVAKDTREPSPFSYALLNANRYAFLDGAPLEERRARAVGVRRSLTLGGVSDLGTLSPDAIAKVRVEAWPEARDRDELHDALMSLGVLPSSEGADWLSHFAALQKEGRAFAFPSGPNRAVFWAATERWPMLRAVYPKDLPPQPKAVPLDLLQETSTETASAELVRGRLGACGPLTAEDLAVCLALTAGQVNEALHALEGEGFAMRGHFSGVPGDPVEWCERRLLARIHRLTLDGLRRQIKPARPEDYLRFLLSHLHLVPSSFVHGTSGLTTLIGQLEGFEAAAGAWEAELFASRVGDYTGTMLDGLAQSGAVVWGRLAPPARSDEDVSARGGMTRAVPMSFALREDLAWLRRGDPVSEPVGLSGDAAQTLTTLRDRGALFFDQLKTATRLLGSQLEEALGELLAAGAVTCDGFAAVRPLVTGPRRPSGFARTMATAFAAAGRWTAFEPAEGVSAADRTERWARLLLRRYGIVFRDLLTRESLAPEWRELVAFYRRLEARGEIRGGRFIEGVGGEQYASAEAVDALRAKREEEANGEEWVVVSSYDPANLVGIVTKDERIPAKRTNLLIIRGGRLAAAKLGDEIKFYGDFSPEVKDRFERALRLSGHYRKRDPFTRMGGDGGAPMVGAPAKQNKESARAQWSRLRLLRS